MANVRVTKAQRASLEKMGANRRVARSLVLEDRAVRRTEKATALRAKAAATGKTQPIARAEKLERNAKLIKDEAKKAAFNNLVRQNLKLAKEQTPEGSYAPYIPKKMKSGSSLQKFSSAKIARLKAERGGSKMDAKAAALEGRANTKMAKYNTLQAKSRVYASRFANAAPNSEKRAKVLKKWNKNDARSRRVYERAQQTSGRSRELAFRNLVKINEKADLAEQRASKFPT